MLPFLLLASRAEDAAADDEYAAYLRYGGLAPSELHRIRLEAVSLPGLDLADYSGIIIGGSPFTSSDPPEHKSAVQHRVERELAGLLDTGLPVPGRVLRGGYPGHAPGRRHRPHLR